jgi:hypothetical protein
MTKNRLNYKGSNSLTMQDAGDTATYDNYEIFCFFQA